MAKRLKFIHSKPHHSDRLYDTGVTWNGPGDVQVVEDDKKAALMLHNHPDMFEEVEADTDAIQEKPAVPAGSPSSLDELILTEADGTKVKAPDASRAALAAYADERLGLLVKDGHNRNHLLTAISNAHRSIERFLAGPSPGARPNGAAGGPIATGINAESGAGAEQPPASDPADPPPGGDSAGAEGTAPAPETASDPPSDGGEANPGQPAPAPETSSGTAADGLKTIEEEIAEERARQEAAGAPDADAA